MIWGDAEVCSADPKGYASQTIDERRFRQGNQLNKANEKINKSTYYEPHRLTKKLTNPLF